MHIRNYTNNFVGGGIVLLAVLAVLFSGELFKLTPLSAATSDCAERYFSSVPVPANYGAAFNVFGTEHEVIFKTSCPTRTSGQVRIAASTSAEQIYTYRNAYRRDGGSWSLVTLSGTPVAGAPDWITGAASMTFASGTLRAYPDYNYIAAYTCTFVNGAWKCGCRDTTCATNLWQLQGFRVPNPGGATTAGTVTTAGTTAGGTTGDDYCRTHTCSGIGWLSGSSDGTFSTWRNRPVDIVTRWHSGLGNGGTVPVSGTNERRPTNWSDFDSFPLGGIGTTPSMVSQGVAMLPGIVAGDFAGCASGQYDSHYRSVAQKIATAKPTAIVRIGWEFNGDTYPWGIGKGGNVTQAKITNFKDCFRRMAQIFNQASPSFQIEWTAMKDSKLGTFSVADAYPGDDVVDIIGYDFYDGYPSYHTEAVWNNDYNSTENGGPRGLGSWLAFAKLHGKKLAIPEWGVRGEDGTEGDNPFFIGKMYEFFNANKNDIAYESYFNNGSCNGDTDAVIFPESCNPQSAARYLQLWGR